MLIDMHAHSKGISRCCKADIEQVLTASLQNKIDGIVLTNHYTDLYLEDYAGIDDFVKKYIAEYHKAVLLGQRLGCKVFFGIEVSMKLYRKVHLLIYGVSPEFIQKHPFLFDMSQQDLYNLVKQNGGILVQAHPFRYGEHLLDLEYLDGLEISSHPKYKTTYSSRIVEIAKREGKLVTCGGDYHADTRYRPRCGVVFQNDVMNITDLVNHLVSTNQIKLLIHEVDADTATEYLFQK